MATDATIGGATATSYVTPVEFQGYAELVGFDLTAHDAPAQAIALVKAAQYLERGYRGLWRGCRASQAQSLAWPRTDVTDVDGYRVGSDAIPTAIREAQHEAAILSLGGVDLTPTIGKSDHTISESVGAGPAQVSESYAPGTSPRDRFTAIEGLLSDYVTGHPGASSWSGTVRR